MLLTGTTLLHLPVIQTESVQSGKHSTAKGYFNMRSTSGFFAAVAFLIVVPIALLFQIIFGRGAEEVIHFLCGAGFALCSLGVHP
jgi:hypothetical protein